MSKNLGIGVNSSRFNVLAVDFDFLWEGMKFYFEVTVYLPPGFRTQYREQRFGDNLGRCLISDNEVTIL